MVQKKTYFQFIAILLLLVVLFHSMNTVFRVAEFQLHRDYYAQNVCINRFSPEEMCNAQCVLDDILNQENNDNNDYINSDVLPCDKYVQNEVHLNQTPIFIILNGVSDHIDNNYVFLWSDNILKPPNLQISREYRV